MLLSKEIIQASVLLSILLSLASLAWWHTLAPPPSHSPVSSTEFSAARAMSHVRVMGSKPHPTGSPENASVRKYLVDEINKLGLKPELQPALIVNPQKRLVGKVTNILTKIPGIKPGKALLLVAHYDSVPTGPGAADDGASVAAMLETLRVLKTLPPLTNDVICLFTDGEESGLIGANAFISQHPWAKNIGVALNFEYRGNRGAFMMFETSPSNGKLIAHLAKSVPFVLANSLMYEVYKLLPNDTDFTVFKNAGIPGMNFAAIEGHTHYHTMLDRPELLDQGSLQHEGNVMLALVKQFGNTDLNNLTAADRVYFDLPVIGLINYPIAWLLPLNVILALVFAWVTYLAIKQKALRLPRVLFGLGLFGLLLLTLPIAAQVLWFAICKLHPQYTTFFQGDTYNSNWYLLAFVLLTSHIFCVALTVTAKWLQPLEFAFAVTIAWLTLSWLTALWLPGASYLLLWPLLMTLAAIGLILKLRYPANHPVNTLLLTLGSIPAIFLYIPLIKGVFVGLTPNLIGVMVALVILVLGLLSLVVDRLIQWQVFKHLCFTGGLMALVIGSVSSGFDNQHPRQDSLFYAVNPAEKKAFWLSNDSQLDEWTAAFFPAHQEKQPVPAIFGSRKVRLWAANAPLPNLPVAAVTIVQDSVENGLRQIKVNIKPLMSSPKMELSVEGVEILKSTVAGASYTRFPNQHWWLDCFGLTEDLQVEFILKPNTPITLRVSNISYGFPGFANPSRPEGMIPKPGEYSETTNVVSTYDY